MFVDIWAHTEVDDFLVKTGAVAAGIGLIVAGAMQFVRKVVRPTVSFFRRASKAWDYIETELSNNGGSTVKDRVDKAAVDAAQAAKIADETRRLVEALADDMARVKVHLRLEDPPSTDAPE